MNYKDFNAKFIYDSVESFREGMAAAGNGDKYGYIDIKGKTVIPFIYDKAYGFFDEVAIAMRGNKWIYIDKTGNEVEKPPDVEPLEFYIGLGKIGNDSKRGYVGKDKMQDIS